MPRTCSVRFDAMKLTLSVRSFQCRRRRDLRLAAELALGADLARHARDLAGERVELITIVLMVFFSSRISPFTSTVILRLRSPRATAVGHLGDVAHLRGQVRAIVLTESVRVLPGAGHAGHDGLHAEAPLGADLARHAR
jgi:hypothetical protein